MQGGEHVERRAIAVGIFAGGKPLGLLFAFAAGEIRNQLEQHIGRRRQRDTVGDHSAQAAVADRKVRRRVKRGEHRCDQMMIVGGKNAE